MNFIFFTRKLLFFVNIFFFCITLITPETTLCVGDKRKFETEEMTGQPLTKKSKITDQEEEEEEKKLENPENVKEYTWEKEFSDGSIFEFNSKKGVRVCSLNNNGAHNHERSFADTSSIILDDFTYESKIAVISCCYGCLLAEEIDALTRECIKNNEQKVRCPLCRADILEYEKGLNNWKFLVPLYFIEIPSQETILSETLKQEQIASKQKTIDVITHEIKDLNPEEIITYCENIKDFEVIMTLLRNLRENSDIKVIQLEYHAHLAKLLISNLNNLNLEQKKKLLLQIIIPTVLCNQNSFSENLKILEILLQKMGPLDSQELNKEEFVDIFQSLINASINSSDAMHPDCLKLLLDNGMKLSHGETLSTNSLMYFLHKAYSIAEHATFIESFKQDKEFKRNYLACLKLLIDYGCNLNQKIDLSELQNNVPPCYVESLDTNTIFTDKHSALDLLSFSNYSVITKFLFGITRSTDVREEILEFLNSK